MNQLHHILHMKSKQELLAELSAIEKNGEKVLASETIESQQKTMVNEEKFHDFRITALSYLSRVFGHDSIYHQTFQSEVTHPTASRTRRGIGILTAAGKELQGGWLESTATAISREVLSDMLHLARRQFEEKNLQASVIIAGAVLEKFLRSLCLSHGIKLFNEIQHKAVDKNGPQLVTEAYKKKLVERKENKDILLWLALYYSVTTEKAVDLTADQIKAMLSGLASLIAKPR